MGKSQFLIVWFVAVAGLVAASFVPSLRPPPEYNADLALHWAGFMALAFMAVAYAGSLRWAIGLCVLLAVVGLGIECVQSFVPNREASLWDLLANCVGIAAGFGGGLMLARYRGHRMP